MKQVRQPKKFLWNEWKTSMHRYGPTLWQYRCGQVFSGPSGSKSARRLAKFLLKYADWVDYHDNKRKQLKKDVWNYYEDMFQAKRKKG